MDQSQSPFDEELIADQLTVIIRDLVASSMQPFVKVIETQAKRIDELERQVKSHEPIFATLEAAPSIDEDDIGRAIQQEVGKQVGALPPAKDGKDADPVLVREYVAEEVRRQMAEVPPAKDGKDVDVNMVRMMIKDEVIAVKQDLQSEVASAIKVEAKLLADDLATSVKLIPVPKDGKDVDIGAVSAMVKEEVQTWAASIPVPKDGTSVDPEQVRAMVVEAVAALPVPKDGEPGKDVDPEVVKAMVAEAVAALPAPKDGKDADPEQITIAVAKAVAEIPQPKDGKDADPADIEKAVQAAVRALPPAKDGRDADPADIQRAVDAAFEDKYPEMMDQAKQFVEGIISGELDVRVKHAVEALPKPQDGKDADPAVVHEMVVVESTKRIDALGAEMLEHFAKHLDNAVAALPKPKDGRDGDPEAIHSMIVEEVRRFASEQPKPKDGKDAPAPDIQKVIEGVMPEVMKFVHSVKMPTPEDFRAGFETEHAKWAVEFERRANDLFQRAIERMPVPKDGKDGFQVEDMTLEHDGDGLITITWSRADGFTKEASFRLPRFKDCGVWKGDGAYIQGDGVTWGGSFFIAQKDAPQGKPGESPDWRCAVKRGRDGKDNTGDGSKGSTPIVRTK